MASKAACDWLLFVVVCLTLNSHFNLRSADWFGSRQQSWAIKRATTDTCSGMCAPRDAVTALTSHCFFSRDRQGSAGLAIHTAFLGRIMLLPEGIGYSRVAHTATGRTLTCTSVFIAMVMTITLRVRGTSTGERITTRDSRGRAATVLTRDRAPRRYSSSCGISAAKRIARRDSQDEIEPSRRASAS